MKRTPKIKRPVLQFRVHHDIYERLKKAARLKKISISEEAQNCIRRSLDDSEPQTKII